MMNFCSVINNRNVFSFLIGFFTFFILSSILKYESADHNDFVPKSPYDSENNFDNFAGAHIHELDDKEMVWKDRKSSSHEGSDIIAKYLKKKIRIFCWILTTRPNHPTKAIHVLATWAKRCNGHVFMSNEGDSSINAINSNVTDGRDHLWQKTKNSLKYIYNNHLNNYDYFLKADDDTFVILENVRYMVKDMNPYSLIYMGRRFKPYVKQGYMSGGGGYLMSRGALKKVVEKGFDKHKDCPTGEGGAEDVNIGACLEAVGVPVIDSLDEGKKERFHPLPPATMIMESHMRGVPWMYSYAYHKLRFGTDCCSDESVTFHYIAPHDMYLLEYFIYHLRPYGIVRDYKSMTTLINQLEKQNELKINEAYHNRNHQKKPEKNSEAKKDDKILKKISNKK